MWGYLFVKCTSLYYKHFYTNATLPHRHTVLTWLDIIKQDYYLNSIAVLYVTKKSKRIFIVRFIAFASIKKLTESSGYLYTNLFNSCSFLFRFLSS